MQSKPLITVYILSYFYGEFIEDALRSVESQTYDKIELIVVNDGAELYTRQICAKKKKFKSVINYKYLENSQAKGLSASANQALACANGDFILRLDADDLLHECAISSMVSVVKDDIDLIYTGFSYIDKKGVNYGIDTQLHTTGNECVSSSPHGACCLIRTRVLRSIGGYSDEIGAQDGYELWVRAGLNGKSRYLDLPLFQYRKHSLSLSAKRDKIIKARMNILKKQKLSQGSYRCSRAIIMSYSSHYINNDKKQAFENFKVAIALAIRKKAGQIFLINVDDKNDLKELQNIYSSNKEVILTNHNHQALDPICVPINQILFKAIEDIKKYSLLRTDLVVYVGSGGNSVDYIDNAIDLLLLGKYDSILSASQLRDILFSVDTNGISILNPGRFEGLMLEKEKLYSFNGDLLVMWQDTFKPQKILGDNVGYIELPFQKIL